MERQTYRCPNCGSPVAFGVKFCVNCGTSIDWPKMKWRKIITLQRIAPEFTEYIHNVRKLGWTPCPRCGSSNVKETGDAL